MLSVRLGFVSLMIMLVAFTQTHAATPTGDASVIQSISDLVAFWTFGEQAGQQRTSTGTTNVHGLSEAGGSVTRVDGGPFSGYAADLSGSGYLSIPYAQTADLNIHGASAEVSMIAFINLAAMRSTTVAGMWSEGSGANDDSGTRQYALLLDIHAYGGNNKVTPHISSEGGVTYRADGSKLPWNVDYAAGATNIELNTWVSVGFTYDSEYIRAYYNGIVDERDLNPVADNRTDPYFTTEGPGGGDRGMNPYYHGRGIFSYDPDETYDPAKIDPPAFTVGARQAGGKPVAETMNGLIGGLAVWDRALTEAEMLAAHQSANLNALNNPAPGSGGEHIHYHATFTVTSDTSNMPLDDFNTANGSNWQAVLGSNASALSGTSSDPIRIADSGVGGVGRFLAQTAANEIGFAWTDDLDTIDVDEVDGLQVTLNNKSTGDSVRFAVRIGGQWFVSDATFSIDPAGIGYNNWANAQTLELDFATDQAMWRLLQLNPGSTLALGDVATFDLSGNVDALGLFMQTAADGLIRADDLGLIAIPEPGTLVLCSLLMLGRRSRAPRHCTIIDRSH